MWNAAKKRAGEVVGAVSSIIDDPAGASCEMSVELDRTEASLQEQLKQLKAFVNGMNSMCTAALSATTQYQGTARNVDLATALTDAQTAIAKDTVKGIAGFLGAHVQRPLMSALEKSKAVRVEVNDRQRAQIEVANAEKRIATDLQLRPLRQKLEACDGHARQALAELIEETHVLRGKMLGGMVSCQQMLAQETGRLSLQGSNGAALAKLSDVVPSGLRLATAKQDTSGRLDHKRQASKGETAQRERRPQQQPEEAAVAAAEQRRQAAQASELSRHSQQQQRQGTSAEDLFNLDAPRPTSTSPPPVVGTANGNGHGSAKVDSNLDSFFGGGSSAASAAASAAASKPTTPNGAIDAPPHAQNGTRRTAAVVSPPPADIFGSATGTIPPQVQQPGTSLLDEFGAFASAPPPSVRPNGAGSANGGGGSDIFGDFGGGNSGTSKVPPPASPGFNDLFGSPPSPAPSCTNTGSANGNSANAEFDFFCDGATASGGGTVPESRAVQAMRERDARERMAEEERLMFVHDIEAEVAKWAGPDYNPKNIRALLANFHLIWKDEKWQPLGVQDLLNGGQCRKAYRKAIRLVHPDKNGDRGPAHLMLAERVFEQLKQEFAKIANEIGDTATAPVEMHSTGPVDSAWNKDNANEVKGD